MRVQINFTTIETNYINTISRTIGIKDTTTPQFCCYYTINNNIPYNDAPISSYGNCVERKCLYFDEKLLDAIDTLVTVSNFNRTDYIRFAIWYVANNDISFSFLG